MDGGRRRSAGHLGRAQAAEAGSAVFFAAPGGRRLVWLLCLGHDSLHFPTAAVGWAELHEAHWQRVPGRWASWNSAHPTYPHITPPITYAAAAAGMQVESARGLAGGPPGGYLGLPAYSGLVRNRFWPASGRGGKDETDADLGDRAGGDAGVGESGGRAGAAEAAGAARVAGRRQGPAGPPVRRGRPRAKPPRPLPAREGGGPTAAGRLDSRRWLAGRAARKTARPCRWPPRATPWPASTTG